MRRTVLKSLLATAILSATAGLPVARAADKEIVIGGSIPMSGVFAFAGIGIHAGIQDYVKMVNAAGGIAGHTLRYVPEDSAYKVDQSVAAFKKITSQNKVNFYYGDSTAFSKTINPELDRAGSMIMSGASRHQVHQEAPRKPKEKILFFLGVPWCLGALVVRI